jgi:hypothetical protein
MIGSAKAFRGRSGHLATLKISWRCGEGHTRTAADRTTPAGRYGLQGISLLLTAWERRPQTKVVYQELELGAPSTNKVSGDGSVTM